MAKPRLSDLVSEREVGPFNELAVKMKGSVMNHLTNEGKVLAAISTALCEVLRETSVDVHVKGSAAKGTQTTASDIDIVVDLGSRRTVSRAEKKAVVDHLRRQPLFHQSHVALKKLAIGCTISGMDVDLVFAQTAEYGQLPGSLDERFAAAGLPTQDAARMLKVAMKQSLSQRAPQKLPSFVLELVAFQAHTAAPGASALHLFIDTLQLLCDSARSGVLNELQVDWLGLDDAEGMDGIRGKRLGAARCVSIQDHARDLCHNFCASRVYSPGLRGFATPRDMECWARGFHGQVVPTNLGDVPSWILGHVDQAAERIVHFMSDQVA